MAHIASSREQALSLLAAAKNHGDLAVKLSSLKQAKNILLSLDPSAAAELFYYLVELQSSPEILVRKLLLEIIEEIGLKALEHSSVVVPVLLTLLRDENSKVASQSIAIGTNFFCSVLEEMAFQFYRLGKVERWLEDLWIWMVRFKDAVFTIAFEPSSVGTKVLALKFLETFVLLFTSNDSEKPSAEGSRRAFNISWVAGGHPVLDPHVLMHEADRTVGMLLGLLRSANSLPGSVAICVVNCLAAIARKRPLHYNTILSALLEFEPNFEMVKGCHAASIQYAFRTAFLGFLRCMNPIIVESRDRLLRALRAINAGDAADHVLRQMDKMMRNLERASRDARVVKEDPLSQTAMVGDHSRKRPMPMDNEGLTNGHEVPSKRGHYNSDARSASSVHINDSRQDTIAVSGPMPHLPQLDGTLTAAEQMIAMIGALLAEGERGVESLELLVSKIHPDLLAEIVITNMKHLPKESPPLTRLGNLPSSQQSGSLSSPAEVIASSVSTSSVYTAQVSSSVTLPSTLWPDPLTLSNVPGETKRDPRRDPRRLDPRRVAVSIGTPPTAAVETQAVQPEADDFVSSSKSVASTVGSHESPSLTLPFKGVDTVLEGHEVLKNDPPTSKEDVMDQPEATLPTLESNDISDPTHLSVPTTDKDSLAINMSNMDVIDDADISVFHDSDEHSPAVSDITSEETSSELPVVPSFIELTDDHQRNVMKSALERILKLYRRLPSAGCNETRMALLARLVSQINVDDDLVTILQKHVVANYQQQKGHELVLHILYHLHSLSITDGVGDSSSTIIIYEKFLLAVVKSLLDTFPASDKSFSRLLGEIPLLPDSALGLLDNLCSADVIDQSGRIVRDVERVTQGLGAVWSLILGRPKSREACLSIALKCAIHQQDEIRAKAIRLVANKLYQISYISGCIEQFATNKLLSAVDQHTSGMELSHSGSAEEMAQGKVERPETSVSCCQVSEQRTSENEPMATQSGLQSVSTISVTEAHQLTSLFFALCTKKPNLVQLVFNVYSRTAKTVKQAIHRHVPIVVRALGSSCTELLQIVSDPPEGTENLLLLVLQILTEDGKPSSDLISTVKHLYETKLKDATILIPMLSSLSKNEVLPIFPRLVDLPLEKFQRALANILQGSAHTGPALTPVEVLVAIHGIRPEKDGLPLKKITDACSACFEQRTVFTQQVLAKALNQMVDQTPLPLLFMRTVIQAIDAFPALVDFVMEILSKLVNRQIWKMPKLWVGFLKCVSQTQPHSFRVLLQLPPPQLESALNRYANLRGPLASYSSQPSIRNSLSRQTLSILGLAIEPNLAPSLHHSDTGPVHRATPT